MSGFPFRTLITERDLSARVQMLGQELTDNYRASLAPPVLIAVLKGSTLFLADLVRAMDIDVEIDFMAISSYHSNEQSAGVVRVIKDIEQDLRGRDVLIVEDIVDTGFTLTYLRRRIAERQPRSLAAITLLDKAARRIVPVDVEHVGFEIPDTFVVGYGLDFQSLYRNLPEILAIEDLAALANQPSALVEPLFGEAGLRG